MKNVTYINAGAGSGKTHHLTETLTQLIKDKKVKPEQVILTTFTTKAANEFKEKAKSFLFAEGMYAEAIQLDHAMIGTVHSVCQKMIGKYWFNLGLSPNMGVMAEEDTKYYISQSLAELPTDEELKVLHIFAKEFDLHETEGFKIKSAINYNFWQDHLKRIIDFATNYEIDDFCKSEDESLAYIRQFVDSGVTLNITDEELDAILHEARSYVEKSNRIRKKDEYYKSFDNLKRNSWNKSIAWVRDIQATIKANYGDSCASVLDRLSKIWLSQEICIKQEAYIKLLFNLAKRWKENFAQFKRDKNLLDYNDMEKYMMSLMQNHSIASEISKSYRYLFVDEFQDSSPIQVKIFDALSDLMEHSYWVGDYKQAIYGFRGSDIALTKAVVDRVSKCEIGCDTDTLDKSWRSLPDIVDVNNAVFEKTFADVLDKENIHLDRVRVNTTEEISLRYFVSDNEDGVAQHILKLLNNGAKPNEIAVLARANATLAKVAESLKGWQIPSSREDASVIDTPVYPLVASLLRIAGSNKDALSKATVAILTESDYNTQRIIEEKILNDTDEETNTEDYLANVPLVRQLLQVRPLLQQESIASLVESMTIELNLYDVVKKLNVDPAFGISCLQTIINTARVYEEHCVQMNLPATIDGFISYIEEIKPVGSGDPDGVQLHTYHSCKGLQWKYVILMSLNTNVAEIKKAIKNETYGVHAIHYDEPTAENPYPEVYIRLTPWIYGTSTNVPDDISAIIEDTEGFKDAYKAMLAEINRVFYVGMTRPKDVLILNIEKAKKNCISLQWPKDIGIDTVAKSIPESGDLDVFGTGHIFKDFTLTESETENLEPYAEYDETLTMPLNIDDDQTFEKYDPRYLSPSGIHSKGEVVSHHNFEKRIPFAKQPSDMATVGDCIHQIFAGIEESRPAYKIELDEIIESYGLKGVLADKEAIILAWHNLAEYLTTTHGPAFKTYHERPFRLERDGQTIVGSIDLVWQTAEGDILVDFKTCPMGPKAVLDAESEHYAGWYAGQLDAYQDALEAAGEKVIKRYIYYPVSGLLAEIDRGVHHISNSYNYANYRLFDQASITTPDGENYVARILTNNKGIAMDCDKVVLYAQNECKIVDIDVFRASAHDNEFITWICDSQFIIEKMPDDKWIAFYEMFSGEVIGKPKTYLLRWNPTISSFTLDTYRKAIVEYPEGFGCNWSIYEYEKAKRGDWFYMLRSGDDNPGIVWSGTFTSDPYEGDDWAGKNRKRMYMNFETSEFEDPDKPLPISIEKLMAAIPDIDWQKGHSGELLTQEQADVLNQLWKEAHSL